MSGTLFVAAALLVCGFSGFVSCGGKQAETATKETALVVAGSEIACGVDPTVV